MTVGVFCASVFFIWSAASCHAFIKYEHNFYLHSNMYVKNVVFVILLMIFVVNCVVYMLCAMIEYARPHFSSLGFLSLRFVFFFLFEIHYFDVVDFFCRSIFPLDSSLLSLFRAPIQIWIAFKEKASGKRSAYTQNALVCNDCNIQRKIIGENVCICVVVKTDFCNTCLK